MAGAWRKFSKRTKRRWARVTCTLFMSVNRSQSAFNLFLYSFAHSHILDLDESAPLRAGLGWVTWKALADGHDASQKTGEIKATELDYLQRLNKVILCDDIVSVAIQSWLNLFFFYQNYYPFLW